MGSRVRAGQCPLRIAICLDEEAEVASQQEYTVKVLVTGAGGFLGRGLVVPFEGQADLRLMDVVDWQTPHEKIVASVADLEPVMKAVEGVDAIVIAHMAPQGASYKTPTIAYDVNVKGTANLFYAANQFGVKKVVLISSGGAVWDVYFSANHLTRELPRRGKGIYGHTKVLQEVIAEQYHHEFGIGVAVLRCGYITDMDLSRTSTASTSGRPTGSTWTAATSAGWPWPPCN